MKKIVRLWIALALLICATLAATAAIPDTLAYMQQESNTVTNKINIVYVPLEDISVPVRVHKTVTSLGEETVAPSGFEFALRCVETGEIVIFTTDGHGYAGTALTFTEADVDKVYHYELTEIAGEDERITYSEKVYDIRIALTVNADNCICADVMMNSIPVEGVMAEFENIFTPVIVPDTGDHDQPLFFAAMMLLSAAGLLLLRRRTAK